MRLLRTTIAFVALTAASLAQPQKADWAKWWPQFQSAVARHDAKAVAGMMHFPADWELGKIRKLQSEADFVANFDKYVPADMIKAVAEKTPFKDPGGDYYTISWKFRGLECTLFFKRDRKGGYFLEALSEGPPMLP